MIEDIKLSYDATATASGLTQSVPILRVENRRQPRSDMIKLQFII